MNVLVLGSGIIGMTAAIRLREAGHEVRLWAAAPWRETVSAVAAAIWYPYRAYPLAQVSRWADRAFDVFVRDAAVPDSGVRMRDGRVFWNGSEEDAGLDGIPSRVREVPVAEVPPGYARGATLSLPVVETPLYLAWLEARLLAMGVRVEVHAVRALDEAFAASPLVVNCTGLGAGELVGDPSVHPIRGQVVRVENPGIDRFTLDAGGHAEEITYVIPRSSDVVLGGTATDGSWSTDPDEASGRRILARCLALDPALKRARVLEHRVGLRPGRPAVRLEREDLPWGTVIHDYGHGGSGVTVCWGCADEVARLAGPP